MQLRPVLRLAMLPVASGIWSACSFPDYRTQSTSTSCSAPVVSTGTFSLIDDMEDRDDFILLVEGRTGRWHLNNDNTPGGEQPPGSAIPQTIVGGRNESNFAIYTAGTGFTTWGFEALVDLTGAAVSYADPVAEGTCFDASAYEGVAFYARGNAILEVGMITPAMVPVVLGGDCDDDDLTHSSCWHHPGPSVSLLPDWKRFEFSWSKFPGGDIRTIHGFRFLIDSRQRPGEQLEMWIDDLSFLGGAGQ